MLCFSLIPASFATERSREYYIHQEGKSLYQKEIKHDNWKATFDFGKAFDQYAQIFI
jgi:hypothetical protein